EVSRPLYLAMAIPEVELLAAAADVRGKSLLMTLLVILIALPVTWFAARAIARPLRQLALEADTIRHFQFSTPVTVNSVIDEVDTLAQTMDGMKGTICRFLDISAAVAGEKDFDRLLAMLLAEPLAVAEADLGGLYLAEGLKLMPVAARDAEGADLLHGLPEVDARRAGPLLDQALADGAARKGALQAGDVSALGLGALAAVIGASQGIAVPLYTRRRELMGVIMLLRR